MTQIVAWLDQHRINAVTVVDTVAILVLASIIILVFSRLLWRLLEQQESRLPPQGGDARREPCRALSAFSSGMMIGRREHSAGMKGVNHVR